MRLLPPATISGEINNLIDQENNIMVIISPYCKLYNWKRIKKSIGEAQKKAFQHKAYLSENYKPWRDTIYLIIYEYDSPIASIAHIVNITTRPGQTFPMEYYTYNNEGPFADKTNSIGLEAYNTLSAASASLAPNNKVLMITPASWPHLGGVLVPSDEVTITGAGSGSGANINTCSIKVKLKYDY